jgi:hypothetical protein
MIFAHEPPIRIFAGRGAGAGIFVDLLRSFSKNRQNNHKKRTFVEMNSTTVYNSTVNSASFHVFMYFIQP